MNFIGIDIGSTCAKVAVLNDKKEIVFTKVWPTGWSSVDTAETIKRELEENKLLDAESRIVATGYGRVAVPYADKTITEITCHGKGATYLFGQQDMLVIDIGGQDTKAIRIQDENVADFIMNDKCSAGTGRFLEVMANTLGIRPDELCDKAREGSGVTISSMCTVFAESEVISLIGRGESRENIAFAVIDSIAGKVISQCSRLFTGDKTVYLTGGLCDCDFLKETMGNKLHATVISNPNSRFAGAIGAAICSMKIKK